MKRILALIMALAMVFCLAACGSSEPAAPADPAAPAGESGQQTEEPADPSTFEETKTGKILEMYKSGPVYAEFESEEDGEVFTIISVTGGDKIVTKMISEGVEIMRTILDGSDYYMIDDNEKMVLKMSAAGDGSDEGVMGAIVEEADLDMETLVIGETEVEGTVYYSESWSEGEDEVIYCFDGSNLKYMINKDSDGEYMVKVIKMSTDIPEGIYDIPEDYEVISF